MILKTLSEAAALGGMAVKGTVNAGKKIGHFFSPYREKTAFTRPGSLDELSPRVFTPLGAGLAATGALAIMATSDALSGGKERELGYTRYSDALPRMTNKFTTGAVPAMITASNGDYDTFSEMAQSVVSNANPVSSAFVDNYGADSKLIRALYNMG